MKDKRLMDVPPVYPQAVTAKKRQRLVAASLAFRPEPRVNAKSQAIGRKPVAPSILDRAGGA